MGVGGNKREAGVSLADLPRSCFMSCGPAVDLLFTVCMDSVDDDEFSVMRLWRCGQWWVVGLIEVDF